MQREEMLEKFFHGETSRQHARERSFKKMERKDAGLAPQWMWDQDPRIATDSTTWPAILGNGSMTGIHPVMRSVETIAGAKIQKVRAKAQTCALDFRRRL
jgi:hypothetical protein